MNQTSPSPAPVQSRHILLQAVDPARNIARGYSIWMARDLFGAWLVETRWGRIGSGGDMGGQSCTRAFADRQSACAYARAVLRRRAGAERRIGVAYRRV